MAWQWLVYDPDWILEPTIYDSSLKGELRGGFVWVFERKIAVSLGPTVYICVYKKFSCAGSLNRYLEGHCNLC